MADTDKINNDALLKDLGGCGLFQVILVIALCLSMLPKYFSYQVMTFGIYNPGWRCLDNVTYTKTTINGTDFTNDVINQAEDNKTSSEYWMDTCQGFETCQHIEFNPEASTIVTEWGLICGKSWAMSVIISCEMAGTVVGFLLAGYLSDRFGRKICLHISIFGQFVLNFIAIWSVSWEMYAVVGILLGIISSAYGLPTVIMTEFVPPKWRIRVISNPSWALAFTIFSVMTMIAKDWTILRIIICLTAFIVFIVLFWVPKSLRWLSINNKKEEISGVVRKIAKVNNVEVPHENVINSLLQNDAEKTRSFTILHLFRKGYRFPSFIIGFALMLSAMIYFALSLGISGLPGNIYENMIILAITELPSNLISISVANAFGRKKSTFTLYLLMSFCLAGVVAMDFLAIGDTKVIGTLVLVVIGKLFLNAGIYVLATTSLEIYPTVIRGTISAYGRMMSIIGGIISPLLIPSDPKTFYICYLAFTAIGLLVSFLVIALPETEGKTLQDTWDESPSGYTNKKATNNQII